MEDGKEIITPREAIERSILSLLSEPLTKDNQNIAEIAAAVERLTCGMINIAQAERQSKS